MLELLPGWGLPQRTLLLVSQQMGLALEFLAALIAGRQALSLHSDGTIVVDGQERVGGEFRVYLGLGSLLPGSALWGF
jgi:hypothetical protein